MSISNIDNGAYSTQTQCDNNRIQYQATAIFTSADTAIVRLTFDGVVATVRHNANAYRRRRRRLLFMIIEMIFSDQSWHAIRKAAAVNGVNDAQYGCESVRQTRNSFNNFSSVFEWDHGSSNSDVVLMMNETSRRRRINGHGRKEEILYKNCSLD